MAKKPPKPKPDEDEAESQRFIEAAKALEADGGLSPTGAEEEFERLMDRAAPPKPLPEKRSRDS
jgi:hypothetical protein